MRLFLFTFLLLKIFSPAYGNTIYYLTKIPNLQVYDLTASNGIKYLKAEKFFKVGIVKNNVQCDKPSENNIICLLYTSPSPRDRQKCRMPSSA